VGYRASEQKACETSCEQPISRALLAQVREHYTICAMSAPTYPGKGFMS
jgi:hypothetical protein